VISVGKKEAVLFFVEKESLGQGFIPKPHGGSFLFFFRREEEIKDLCFILGAQ
jgi:hypothetical protein